MTEKKLGKISQVRFGHGGYQDAMLGIHLTFTGEGWGVDTSIAHWDAEQIPCSDRSKWSEQDRDNWYASTMRRVSTLLADAKVRDVMALMNKPVEVTFEDNTLKGWRLLTEVI